MNVSYMTFPAIQNRELLARALNKRTITTDDIMQAVVMVTGVERSELTGSARNRNIVDARKIASYLFRKYMFKPLRVMAAELNSSHDLIIYYDRIARQLVETSKDFAKLVEQCENELK